MFPTLKKLIKGKRQALQQQNLDLALKNISPDIIHLQWPSVIPWFEVVLMEQKIPVVLSQRGFHSNVRPFVDEANFEYLNKWYPKIAGFHSVSKAIAANGDKIWNTVSTQPNLIDIKNVKKLYKLFWLNDNSPKAIPSFQIKYIFKNFDANISEPLFILSK